MILSLRQGVEETEAKDELNIACPLVNHFEVDEDINIEIQQEESCAHVVLGEIWREFLT